jgi:hypothetical protein
MPILRRHGSQAEARADQVADDRSETEETALTGRRFPPPWSIEEHNDACFIVRDPHSGGRLRLFRGRPSVAKLLTRDEARRIAANIAKLPGLLQKS